MPGLPHNYLHAQIPDPATDMLRFPRCLKGYKQRGVEMKRKTTSEIVDSWIAKEDLPVMASQKKREPAFLCLFDEDYELAGEELELENQAYRDFINYCMGREHSVLMSIPKSEHGKDFYIPIETDDSISFAFSSADFLLLYGREFNRESYMIKKLYERVKDLAQTYSVIVTMPEIGRRNTLRKFLQLVSDLQNKAVKVRCFQIWNWHAYERGKGWGRV